jgi:hypothetical protein
MFQRLAILAMVTTLLGVGQTVSHDKRNVKRVSPSVQVDQPPAPVDSQPNKPKDTPTVTQGAVSVDKLPVISGGRDWIDKTALLFSLFALLFTGALVTIGILGIRSANETLRTIELQVVEMRAQTSVNRKMAEVARVNAEALMNSERSLILVSHNAPTGSDTWDFKFMATNYGRSPAEILWIFFEPIPLNRDNSLPEWPIYERPEQPMLMHREWVPPQGNIQVGDYYTQAIADMAAGGLWAGGPGLAFETWDFRVRGPIR